MKLKRFKEKNHKRIGILIFTIVCISLVSGAILYRTFAIFEVRIKQNVIKGTVQDPGNLYFAFYVNNEIQKEMPQRESGYILDEENSYCGVTGENDSNIKVVLTEDWKIVVSGVTSSRTKCNLKFVKGTYILGKPVKAVTNGDGLYEVTHTDVNGTINDDGFKESEWRYAGKSPNNYIMFNNEKWQIIGLVNVMTSETNVEQRIKITKQDSIGEYRWDHKPNGIGSSTSSDYGSNNWTDSQLMEMLNGIYYESGNGNCYAKTQMPDTCNFDGSDEKTNHSHGFNTLAKSMIDEQIVWNIGGTSDYQWDGSGLTKHWYNYERGNKTYENMDTIWKKENTKTSTGTTQPDLFHSIGLIYPSDYGYATSGGTKGREYCLAKALYFWQTDDFNTECVNHNWIYKDNIRIHTLTSYSGSSYQNFWIEKDGQLIGTASGSIAEVFPTLYLKNNVKIIYDSQDGSENKPYHLKLVE